MLNAKEARENMKEYEESQKGAQLERVDKWLENVEKRIISASVNGNDNITISDMEIFSDSVMACRRLEELGYAITRASEANLLKISWRE